MGPAQIATANHLSNGRTHPFTHSNKSSRKTKLALKSVNMAVVYAVKKGST